MTAIRDFQIDGKPVKFYMTAKFREHFGDMEACLYLNLAERVLAVHPVDMVVFEQPRKNRQQIRLAGYYLAGEKKGQLDESTIAWSDNSLETPTFWLKLDEDPDVGMYVAVFLFPDEY